MQATNKRIFLTLFFSILVFGLVTFGIYYYFFKPLDLLEVQKSIFQVKKLSANGKTLSVGTAFKIRKTQYITAAHVIDLDDDSYEIENHYQYVIVNYFGEQKNITRIRLYDLEADIAIFETDPFKHLTKPLRLSGDFDIHEKVWAAGNTHNLGILFKDANIGFKGVDPMKDIKIYGPIASGDSGGPIITRRGDVVGLVKEVYPREQLAIGTSAVKIAKLAKSKYFNFKPPIDFIKKFYKNLPIEGSPRSIAEAIFENRKKTILDDIEKKSKRLLGFSSFDAPDVKPKTFSFRDYQFIEVSEEGKIGGLYPKFEKFELGDSFRGEIYKSENPPLLPSIVRLILPDKISWLDGFTNSKGLVAKYLDILYSKLLAPDEKKIFRSKVIGRPEVINDLYNRIWAVQRIHLEDHGDFALACTILPDSSFCLALTTRDILTNLESLKNINFYTKVQFPFDGTLIQWKNYVDLFKSDKRLPFFLESDLNLDAYQSKTNFYEATFDKRLSVDSLTIYPEYVENNFSKLTIFQMHFSGEDPKTKAFTSYFQHYEDLQKKVVMKLQQNGFRPIIQSLRDSKQIDCAVSPILNNQIIAVTTILSDSSDESDLTKKCSTAFKVRLLKPSRSIANDGK